MAPVSSHAKRAGDGKGRGRNGRGRGEGEEASPETPPPAGSRSHGRADELASSLFRGSLETVRGGCFRALPSTVPRKVLREGGHTSDPALELCPLSMSEFHRHPNTGIRSTKF
jgi:hypothetical protein